MWIWLCDIIHDAQWIECQRKERGRDPQVRKDELDYRRRRHRCRGRVSGLSNVKLLTGLDDW